MDRLKRAVEAHDLADAVLRLETGEPTASLDADPNTRWRLVKESGRVAGLGELAVEIGVSHRAPKLDQVEPERDGGRADHRAEDRSHSMVERGRRTNLEAVCAGESEPLRGARKTVVELVPPTTRLHKWLCALARFVHDARDHQRVFHLVRLAQMVGLLAENVGNHILDVITRLSLTGEAAHALEVVAERDDGGFLDPLTTNFVHLTEPHAGQ
jgi:hypothetical protein